MPTFTGMVNEAGEFEHRKELDRYFASNCMRRVVVETKRYQKPRSNQQNRAVLGFWMSIILDEIGYFEYQRNDVYYHIKSLCWFDPKTKIPKPTSNLDQKEYSDFMEIFRHCVHDTFGIWLPDPKKTLALI